MPALPVVRLGHPALRERSVRVRASQIANPAFQTFLDDLAQTCVEGNGAGIAAPQVGINQRVIVVRVDPANPRYPGKRPFPLTIVLNPVVRARGTEVKEDWEGDMSVNLRGLVPRPTSCVVTGLDRTGRPVSYTLDYDFHARVFQHEIDHLDGKMFVDRVRRKASLAETAEWERYLKPRP